MATRRDFLKHSGLLTGGLMTSSILLPVPAPKKQKLAAPGLQLYTVRDAMESDARKALARVAALGYREVETANYHPDTGYYGLKVKDFIDTLNQNGLTARSGHFGYGEPGRIGSLMDSWEMAVEDAARVGMEYMVCSSLPSQHRKTLDGYKRAAEVFNQAGETCKSMGIQFGYHNHAFEFPLLDGRIPYEVLLEETDSDLVKMEMDIYWFVKGGMDPEKMIKKNPGRYELWHVKDMDATDDQYYTEVGNGMIDWKKLFRLAKKSGMKYYFVEQDRTPGDPFNSIRQSIRYLQKNIL